MKFQAINRPFYLFGSVGKKLFDFDLEVSDKQMDALGFHEIGRRIGAQSLTA